MDCRPPPILLVEDEPSLHDNVTIALEAEAIHIHRGLGYSYDARP